MKNSKVRLRIMKQSLNTETFTVYLDRVEGAILDSVDGAIQARRDGEEEALIEKGEIKHHEAIAKY
jgi:hypothetical protein